MSALPDRCWDAVVIGGGPAGGLTASLLAAAGWRVLLTEAHSKLPARVCGAYLCPAGVALLERLGRLDSLTGGCRALEGMILHAPDFRRLVTRFPRVPGLPGHGLALDRPGFDERLLAEAVSAGAVVRMGVRLVGGQCEDGGWSLTFADGSRERTRLLVGADGRKSMVARLMGVDLPPPRRRVALHADVAALVPAPPFGEMHVFADGSYAGLNNLTPGTVNVSTVCNAEVLRGVAPHRYLNSRIEASPHLRGRLEPVQGPQAVGATFPATHAVRSVIGPAAALVGDAGGFIDPLTGEGIYMALWMAAALSERLADAGPGNLTAALAAYGAARNRAHRGKQFLNRLFQHCIARPSVANGILRFLSWKQGTGDVFVGLIGNLYTPGRAMLKLIASLAGPESACRDVEAGA